MECNRVLQMFHRDLQAHSPMETFSLMYDPLKTKIRNKIFINCKLN